MALTRIPDSFIQDLTCMFFARRTSAQTISTSTHTRIAFDTAVTNIGSSYSTGTNLFTAPRAGYYLASATVDYSAVATANSGERHIYFYRDETDIIGRDIIDNETDGTVGSTTQRLIYLAAGQTLGVNVFQDSGGNYTVRNPAGTFNYGTNFSVFLVRLADHYSASTATTEAMVTDNRTKHKFRVIRNTAQSFANGSLTTILFNSETYDADGAYNTANGEWTAPYTGYYYLGAQFNWTRSGSNGTRVLWMVYNPASTNALIAKDGDNMYTQSAGNALKISTIFYFTAGDKVICQGVQSNGSSQDSISSDSGQHCVFEGFYLGKPT